MPPTPPGPEAALLEATLFEMKKVIVGQDRAIERLLVALIARGHILLEGVPGLAKTLAVETLASVTGGEFARLQFTPDMLPADITGTRIYRQSSESFDVELGPVFANFVLADEINRAPAKVQSALLEVMAEKKVSIGGRDHPVPQPFLVLATQNPIESEGVYTLPEAQRDRFLMKVNVGYPSPQEEVEIVHRVSIAPPRPTEVLGLDDLVKLQHAADRVYVDHGVVDYAVNLVLATRDPEAFNLPELVDLIGYGASPRASIGLVQGARALALLRGRTYALPQDVFDIAPEVLRHRLILTYEALAQGLVEDQILTRVLSTVPAPRIAPQMSRGEPVDDPLLRHETVSYRPHRPDSPAHDAAPAPAPAPPPPGQAAPAPAPEGAAPAPAPAPAPAYVGGPASQPEPPHVRAIGHLDPTSPTGGVAPTTASAAWAPPQDRPAPPPPGQTSEDRRIEEMIELRPSVPGPDAERAEDTTDPPAPADRGDGPSGHAPPPTPAEKRFQRAIARSGGDTTDPVTPPPAPPSTTAATPSPTGAAPTPSDPVTPPPPGPPPTARKNPPAAPRSGGPVDPPPPGPTPPPPGPRAGATAGTDSGDGGTERSGSEPASDPGRVETGEADDDTGRGDRD